MDQKVIDTYLHLVDKLVEKYGKEAVLQAALDLKKEYETKEDDSR